MKTIAIIQHVANDGPSFFATWLAQNDLPFQVFRMFDGDALPAAIGDHSGLCLLGGPMSANDPLHYFPRLLEQVREAIALDIPVIGHCLGGQLLSRALGGTVQASENTEIGWSDLEACHPRASDWFGPEPRLPLFQWHGESFSIPPNATQLVRGTYCANQAYLVGEKHLGMQFHCEVDEPKVREWLAAGEAELQACASPSVQQAQALLPTIGRDMERSQALASRIYSKWSQGLQR